MYISTNVLLAILVKHDLNSKLCHWVLIMKFFTRWCALLIKETKYHIITDIYWNKALY